ncbi:MAG: lycopene cyclase domain-containing protein [Chloroflexota bacterium]
MAFLGAFLGIPLACALAYLRPKSEAFWVTMLGVSILAVVYTGPWDSLIIANGVWSYGSHRVLGLLIGHVPIEEYAFYLLQVLLAGTVTTILLKRYHPR